MLARMSTIVSIYSHFSIHVFSFLTLVPAVWMPDMHLDMLSHYPILYSEYDIYPTQYSEYDINSFCLCRQILGLLTLLKRQMFLRLNLSSAPTAAAWNNMTIIPNRVAICLKLTIILPSCSDVSLKMTIIIPNRAATCLWKYENHLSNASKSAGNCPGLFWLTCNKRNASCTVVASALIKCCNLCIKLTEM